MMTLSSAGITLRDVALFRSLPLDDITALAGQVIERRHARNELIFSQGDPGDGLYVVIEGQISISRQNADGDQLILALYEPGEYFGELALFDDEPRSATAIAIDESSSLFLSRSRFRAFLEAHPGAMFACVRTVVRQLRRLTDLADEIALLDVRSRLARRLFRLYQGMVETDVDRHHPPRTSLRITQQQLANMLGATRESVNKHLNDLVHEGIIQLERGRIHILDVERLRKYSQGFE